MKENTNVFEVIKTVILVVVNLIVKLIHCFTYLPTYDIPKEPEDTTCKLLEKKIENFRHNEKVDKRYIIIGYLGTILICLVFGIKLKVEINNKF